MSNEYITQKEIAKLFGIPYGAVRRNLEEQTRWKVRYTVENGKIKILRSDWEEAFRENFTTHYHLPPLKNNPKIISK